jgi:hypothetical protein
MKYFKNSTDLGNSSEMNNYVRRLKEGFLSPKDLIEGMKYFKNSTDLGNSFAQSYMINLQQNHPQLQSHK